MMTLCEIPKRAGKVPGGISQKRDKGSRPPFIRISQARSGILIHISRSLWASKPECDAHVCLNLGFTSQNFRLAKFLYVCATSGCRPPEWTKGTSCLVSTGSGPCPNRKCGYRNRLVQLSDAI